MANRDQEIGTEVVQRALIILYLTAAGFFIVGAGIAGYTIGALGLGRLHSSPLGSIAMVMLLIGVLVVHGCDRILKRAFERQLRLDIFK